MDSDAFDRLTRLLGAPGTRRGSLGALLTAAVLGMEHAGASKRGRKREKNRLDAAVAPGLRSCPDPKPGQNLSQCDFSRADLRGRSLRGANLSGANFTGAELCGVDLRGANVHRTDFTGAHLTRADLRGTNLATAILNGTSFCQTRRPNGRLDHTHCPPQGTDVCCGDDECDGVCQRGACLERSCHNLGQLCDIFAPRDACGHCCGSTPPTCDNRQVICAPELDVVTFRCRQACDSDADCAPFGDNFECAADVARCVFGKCCREKACRRDNDCASGKCCAESTKNAVCCRRDQRCGVPAFELPCVDL